MSPQTDARLRVFCELTNALTVSHARIQMIRRHIDRGTIDLDRLRADLMEAEGHLLRVTHGVGALQDKASETR